MQSEVEVPFFAREPALLIVLSGPAAAGKDSICDVLCGWYPTMHKVTTVTTREPREGEVDGVDYHFITQDHFDTLRDTGGFVEYATVYGKSYGVPRIEIEDPIAFGWDAIARVDVQGAATLKRLFPDALLIFITPGSIDEAAERMRQRSQDSDAQQQQRIETARAELAAADTFDYVVVNERDRLQEAASEVAKIIAAEKRRRTPDTETPES